MMKTKIRYLMVLLFLSIVSPLFSQVHPIYEQLEELHEGDTIAMYATVGTNVATKWMSATGVTTIVSDSSIYVVEQGPEINEKSTIYLKNLWRDAYLSFYPDEEITGSNMPVLFSKDKMQAIAFWYAKNDTSIIDNEENPFYFFMNPGKDYTMNNENSLVFPMARNMGAFVTGFSDPSIKYWCLSTAEGAGPPQITAYKGVIAFNVFRTSSLVDYAASIEKIFEKYPMGIEEAYSPGNQPGDIPQELYTNLIEAFNVLLKAYEEGDNTKMQNAYEDFMNKNEKAQASIIEFHQGYYTIVSPVRAASATIYDDGKSLLWESLNPDEPISDARYIFKVTQDEEGFFYIQNLSTLNYVVGTGSLYTPIPTGDEAYPHTFTMLPNNEIQITTEKSSSTAYQANNRGEVILWYPDKGLAKFVFNPVAEDVVTELNKILVQQRLNDTLKVVLNEAQRVYHKSRNYTSVATDDANFEAEGYLKDSTQIISNADWYDFNSAQSGGGIAALVNKTIGADALDYFRSVWSNASAVTSYHNLQLDLKSEVNSFVVKMGQRWPVPAPNRFPTKMTILASNDTTSEGQWDEIASINVFENPQDSIFVSEGIELMKPYRYIRLDVTQNYANYLVNGFADFFLGELQIYNAEYEVSTSQFERISNKETFEQRLHEAQKALSQGTVTQEIIDQLRQEYNLFITEFVDYDLLDAKLQEARAYVENSAEGTEVGYFPVGALAAYNEALDNIEQSVDNQSTKDEFMIALDKINAEMRALDKQLILPELDTWYYIYCKSASEEKGAAKDAVVMGNYDSRNFNVEWTKPEVFFGENKDLKMGNEPFFFWRFIEAEDDSVYIQNYGTGLYLNNSGRLSETPTSIAFVNPLCAGKIAFAFPAGWYVNAKPNASEEGRKGNIVSASTCKENGLYTVEKVKFDTDEALIHTYKTGIYQPIVLPYSFDDYNWAGDLYVILGQKNGNLVLKHFDPENPDDLKPAGTPYVYYADATSEEETMVYEGFYSTGSVVDKAVSEKGINATFVRTQIPVTGAAFFNTDGDIEVTNELAYFTNTYDVWFDSRLPETEEEGDLLLPLNGELTNISHSVVLKTSALVDVYTLSGKKIRHNVVESKVVNELPQGIYIIGNKKVVISK